MPSAVKLIGSLVEGNLITLASAPSVAMGMTYIMTADSISLEMENATANQQRGQVIATASLVQVTALIISKGASSST